MTAIVHRCAVCGHPDVWGQRQPHPVLGLTGALPAGCGQPCPDCAGGKKCRWNPEPVPMARFTATGQPVTAVLPPGSEAPWYTARATHDCPACQALYRRLTADQPERTTTP